VFFYSVGQEKYIVDGFPVFTIVRKTECEENVQLKQATPSLIGQEKEIIGSSSLPNIIRNETECEEIIQSNPVTQILAGQEKDTVSGSSVSNIFSERECEESVQSVAFDVPNEALSQGILSPIVAENTNTEKAKTISSVANCGREYKYSEGKDIVCRQLWQRIQIQQRQRRHRLSNL
jgi:hypothetical protein